MNPDSAEVTFRSFRSRHDFHLNAKQNESDKFLNANFSNFSVEAAMWADFIIPNSFLIVEGWVHILPELFCFFFLKGRG